MRDFTKKRIAEITGLTQRQVQFYTEQGIVAPEIDAGEGRGKTRLYSDHNLVQFMVIKGLTELGMTVSKIRPVIRDIVNNRFVDLYWEKWHKAEFQGQEGQLYIKIFKNDDGTLSSGYTLSIDEKIPLLKQSEISEVDECIIINFGRIAKTAESK